MQCQAENQRRSGVPRVGSRRQEVSAVRKASDRREGQTKGRKEKMLHFIMHQKTIPSKRTTRFVFECTHPIRASFTFWWLRKKLSKNVSYYIYLWFYSEMVLIRKDQRHNHKKKEEINSPNIISPALSDKRENGKLYPNVPYKFASISFDNGNIEQVCA
uniref:(northern house mosquito) hypothetical protein n=1 Tax=Culex pipiens TaxID=7175 RepID=A0A8D8AKM2_CULPI